MDATLSFYGAAGRVTGANFLLETSSHKVLVDCGLIQGGRAEREKNRDPFPYDPSSVDALFVTHAHLDHIGRIPKLVKEGFAGAIYSTPATRELATVMFDDGLALMEQESRREGTLPLYERADVEQALSQWQTLEYHVPEQVAGFSARLSDAGHILGSAMVSLTPQEGGKRIVFTGDLGNSPAPLLADTEELPRAEYLVMESVYGDRNHEERDDRVAKLKDAVLAIHERGGTLLIPSFSIDRTQVLIYELNNLVEDGEVPPLPVFLDSPLAVKTTAIYKKYQNRFNPEVRAEIAEGDDIFQFPKFHLVGSGEESRAIADRPGPKIILAGSGMSVGGRILGHERAYLPDRNSMLLIVGYQAAGSLGRRLIEGAKEVTIDGHKTPVRAEVREIRGYSAHKDSNHLIDFVAGGADSLNQVFLAMGEPKAASFLAQRLHDYLGLDARVPKEGQSYSITL